MAPIAPIQSEGLPYPTTPLTWIGLEWLPDATSVAFGNIVKGKRPDSDNGGDGQDDMDRLHEWFMGILAAFKEWVTKVWEDTSQDRKHISDWLAHAIHSSVDFVWVTCVINHPYWTSLALFTFALGMEQAIWIAIVIVIFGWTLLQFNVIILLLIILYILGFARSGVREGSLAANYQSTNYGAVTPSGGPFARSQYLSQSSYSRFHSPRVPSAPPLQCAGSGWLFVLRVLAFVAGVGVLSKAWGI